MSDKETNISLSEYLRKNFESEEALLTEEETHNLSFEALDFIDQKMNDNQKKDRRNYFSTAHFLYKKLVDRFENTELEKIDSWSQISMQSMNESLKISQEILEEKNNDN